MSSKSSFIRFGGAMFLVSLIFSSAIGQNQHFHVLHKISIPEEAGTINVKEFFLKDTANFGFDPELAGFMNEIAGTDEKINFKKESYSFIQVDSTVNDAVELMGQIQGCAIDVRTEPGKMETLKRLHAIAWILQQYLKGNKLIDISDIETDENFYEYGLGWFRLPSDLIIQLRLYRTGNRLTLYPVIQGRSVYADMYRFLVVTVTEKDLCKTAKPKGSIGPNIYDKIPDIRLPGINGDTLSLYSLRGKFVYIDFWASWCGPCRHEFPELIEKYNRFKDKSFTSGEKGLAIFGVSLDKDQEKWKDAIKKDGTPWPDQVIDVNSWEGTYKKFLNMGIPAGILIDGNGIIIAKYFDMKYLEERLN